MGRRGEERKRGRKRKGHNVFKKKKLLHLAADRGSTLHLRTGSRLLQILLDQN